MFVLLVIRLGILSIAQELREPVFAISTSSYGVHELTRDLILIACVVLRGTRVCISQECVLTGYFLSNLHSINNLFLLQLPLHPCHKHPTMLSIHRSSGTVEEGTEECRMAPPSLIAG